MGLKRNGYMVYSLFDIVDVLREHEHRTALVARGAITATDDCSEWRRSSGASRGNHGALFADRLAGRRRVSGVEGERGWLFAAAWDARQGAELAEGFLGGPRALASDH